MVLGVACGPILPPSFFGSAARRSPLYMLPFQVFVQPLLHELDQYPLLWNDFDLRTNHPASPHREMDDIIVRYNARENFAGDRDAFNGPHDSVWWESAKALPSAMKLAFRIMHHVEGERLGMVLITRQPPGATCYPHVDRGWHARHYEKFAIQLAAAPGQMFCVQPPGQDPKMLETKSGDCFSFDNSIPHWVTNPTNETRMTMIVCVRTRYTESRSQSCQ